MAEQILDDEHIETTPERARQGVKGVDILAMLAVSTFLAVIGLTTFFITTAVSH